MLNNDSWIIETFFKNYTSFVLEMYEILTKLIFMWIVCKKRTFWCLKISAIFISSVLKITNHWSLLKKSIDTSVHLYVMSTTNLLSNYIKNQVIEQFWARLLTTVSLITRRFLNAQLNCSLRVSIELRRQHINRIFSSFLTDYMRCKQKKLDLRIMNSFKRTFDRKIK
jgi:hypothetical protein